MLTAQFATTSDLNLTPYNMATSTIKMLDIEDVTSKLTFDAVNKKAVRVGNVVHFWAELLFQTYIAEYSYNFAVDASILPKSGLYPLSATMTDINFTPRGVVMSWASSTGVYWRTNTTNGNYLMVSGTWVID